MQELQDIFAGITGMQDFLQEFQELQENAGIAGAWQAWVQQYPYSISYAGKCWTIIIHKIFLKFCEIFNLNLLKKST